MSSDKERTSSNAFEWDSNPNTEVEQLFRDEEKTKIELRVEVTNHKIDQLFDNEIKVEKVDQVCIRSPEEVKKYGNHSGKEVAVDQNRVDEEVAWEGNHGDEEVNKNGQCGDEFNERKLLSIRRWYRTGVTIAIPGSDNKAHLPPVR